MKIEKYSLSFTAGGLMQAESVMLAELYLRLGDWQRVRNRVLEENLLQSRTQGSLKRLSGEAISRLERLDDHELVLLVEAAPSTQLQLLWLGICRRYAFIADFALEVLHERYVTLKSDLQPAHYEAFFYRKAEWHPELEKLSESTKYKLRQVLFKMLQQVGLINAQGDILPTLLAPEVSDRISQSAEWMWFPIFKADICISHHEH